MLRHPRSEWLLRQLGDDHEKHFRVMAKVGVGVIVVSACVCRVCVCAGNTTPAAAATSHQSSPCTLSCTVVLLQVADLSQHNTAGPNDDAAHTTAGAAAADGSNGQQQQQQQQRAAVAELCKRCVELDRCAAAAEVGGYTVGLFKVLAADTMTKNDVIVGLPPAWCGGDGSGSNHGAGQKQLQQLEQLHLDNNSSSTSRKLMFTAADFAL